MGFLSSIGSAVKSGGKKVKKAVKSVKGVADKAIDAIDKITDNDFTEFALNAGGTLIGVPNAGSMARDAVNTAQNVLDGDASDIAKSVIKQTGFKMPANLKSGLGGIMKTANKLKTIADAAKTTIADVKLPGSLIQYKDVSNFISNNKSAFIAGAIGANHATSWLAKSKPSDLIKSLFM